jgi:hypothetical protein
MRAKAVPGARFPKAILIGLPDLILKKFLSCQGDSLGAVNCASQI